MVEAPKLIDLCLASIRDELLKEIDNDGIAAVIFEIPSELFRNLLPLLPPLALQKLQEDLSLDFMDEFDPTIEYNGGCRKRGRFGILDASWRELHRLRWPTHSYRNKLASLLDKHGEAKGVSTVDWQQLYWEAHLQDCVDAVAEIALLPSFDGSIGDIQIPDAIVNYIGYQDLTNSARFYFKFSSNCQRFGIYARYLRLPNVLCVEETCHLLQSSKLENLELQWIKSVEHVEGLCKLLNQNSETLKSIDFVHCKLSSVFVDAICSSLNKKGLQIHGIRHFSIKISSFLQTDSSPIPVGLTTLLTSGRFLRSLTLYDDQLGPNFARKIFNTLLDASASICVLDLSENNISGFLSHFRWRSTNHLLGIVRSLQSLRDLILRSNGLFIDDIDSLKQALVYMPNLQNLDLSENPIKDGLRSLIQYFSEISSRDLPFLDLKLENCELTYNQLTLLLEILSTMKTPLNELSIKGNHVGRDIGAALGKYICSGIRVLDVEDIGLGTSGFLKAQKEICSELKLVRINISNNQGKIEAAKFMTKIMSLAPKIVAIDARFNSMPKDSLSVIISSLNGSKGTLEHLDLSENYFSDHLADYASVMDEIRIHRKISINVSVSSYRNVPYDDDP